MNKNIHPIDELFKTGLQDEAEAPPAGLWDVLDSKLDKAQIRQVTSKYKRLRLLSGVLLIMVGGLTAYLLTANQHGEPQTPASPQKAESSHPIVAIQKQTKKPETNPGSGNPALPPAFLQKKGQKAVQKTGERPMVAGSTPNLANPAKNNPLASNTESFHAQAPVTRQKRNSAQQRQAFYNQAASSSAEQIIGQQQVAGKTKLPSGNLNQSQNQSSANLVKENNVNTALPLQAGASDLPSGGGIVTRAEINPDLQAENGFSELSTPNLSNLMAVTKVSSLFRDNMLQASNALTENSPAVYQLRKNHHSGRIWIEASGSFVSLESRIKKGEEGHRDNDRDEIKNSENEIHQISYGVSAGYQVSPRLLVKGGLQNTRYSISISQKNIIASKNRFGDVQYRYNTSAGYTFINPKSGTAPGNGDTAKALWGNNNITFLSVPLSLQYQLLNNRFGLSIEAGCITRFLTGSTLKTTLEFANQPEHHTQNALEGLRSMTINGFGGLDFTYKLTPRLTASFSPQFHFALSSLNKDSHVNSFPFGAGISGGLRLSIGQH